ncbi:hypothetical protein GCK32_003924 [Trichostrongylus colubriformis]|uniref:Teneurin-like YD-shell domain-containing protein n=1 Tax=Trichostrongylus colubriformis TaxID=6319 RepID=A0AAN8FBW6_TRICO
MMHETSLDVYRQPISLKIVIGDVRLSLMSVRDTVGRAVMSAWRTIAGDFRETRSLDAQGRLEAYEMNGKERWLFKYNNDSCMMLMNDVAYEWHAGGVPKKAGRVGYTVDSNGWTIKIGINHSYLVERLVSVDLSSEVTFELDGCGRLILARGPSIDMKLDYDYHNPLIPITTGARDYLGMCLENPASKRRIHRDPLGRIVADTKPAFWTPLGLRGVVDIPELSVVIMPHALPYDTLIGGYMSFGPSHIARIRFDDIIRSVDPFAIEPVDMTPLIPTDLKTWFRLAGPSSSLLPIADLRLHCRQHVCARSDASFPSHLRVFSQGPSLASSDLLDETFTSMYPSKDVAFTVEDSGFHELVVLTPNGKTTTVESLPGLSANESALIKSVIGPGHETGWRVLGTSWERHLVRPDSVPDTLTSASLPHFTLVVSRNAAEFRNGKTKIFVHFASDAETVNKALMEDPRRKEGPAVWRAERRRVKRGESRQQWTRNGGARQSMRLNQIFKKANP